MQIFLFSFSIGASVFAIALLLSSLVAQIAQAFKRGWQRSVVAYQRSRVWLSLSPQESAGLQRLLKATGLTNRIPASVKRQLSAQLPDALHALSSSLRAGFSLPDAVLVVERETIAPVNGIFKILARGYAYGIPIADVARMVADQIKLEAWDLVSETLSIHRKVGGNIATIMDHVAVTIMDKQKVNQEVKAATATGRYSGLVIALLVPFSFMALFMLAPEYVSLLYTTTIGKTLLGAAAALELIGFFIIIRIVKVDF